MPAAALGGHLATHGGPQPGRLRESDRAFRPDPQADPLVGHGVTDHGPQPGARNTSESLMQPDRFALPTCGDVLRLQVLVDAFEATLAPDAGLLHAAERGGRVGHQPAVEAYHPDLEALADA
jgi:hypothetical protein